jgi:hypothetical protein
MKDSRSYTRPSKATISAPTDSRPTLHLPSKVIRWKKQATTLETYRTLREFTFLHYYAGSDDLGKAVVGEANLRGLTAVHMSRDMLKDGSDLTTAEPYTSDFKEMMEGNIDGFHAGFDCSTWTRARFNQWDERGGNGEVGARDSDGLAAVTWSRPPKPIPAPVPPQLCDYCGNLRGAGELYPCMVYNRTVCQGPSGTGCDMHWFMFDSPYDPTAVGEGFPDRDDQPFSWRRVFQQERLTTILAQRYREENTT